MYRMSVAAAAIGLGLLTAGAAQAATVTVFSQDFSGALGADETVSGQFQTANGYLGHNPAQGYAPNERSYYEVTLDLTELETVFMSFDWNAVTEKGFDGWNVMATTTVFTPFQRPLDATTPIYNGDYGFGRGFTGSGSGSSVIDLSAFAGQVATVRFNFFADYAAQFAGVQFDNIRVYGDEVDGAAVPEPATWAMMILGFAGVGASLRSRRRILAA